MPRSCRNTLAPFVAFAVVAGVVAAQSPGPSREELARQWDLNRDGKVDEAEAEIARARMRRQRAEAQQAGRVDPLTGRPQTGAGMPSDRPGGDNDDLLLVPGDGSTGRGSSAGSRQGGDRPGRAGAPAVDEDYEAERARRRESARSMLPGNRAPELESPLPSVKPPHSAPASVRPPLPGSVVPGSVLPGRMTQPPSAAARRPDAPGGASARPPSQPWEQLRGPLRPATTQSGATQPGGMQSSTNRTPSPGPGIISGGVRAGMSPARPVYGGPTAGNDLNAGRLPAGPPQTRGPTGAGNLDRAAGGGPTGVRSPTAGTIVGGSRPLPPRGQTGGGGPTAGRPSTPVPQPSTAPRLPAVRPSTPRPPAPGPDDFFNR